MPNTVTICLECYWSIQGDPDSFGGACPTCGGEHFVIERDPNDPYYDGCYLFVECEDERCTELIELGSRPNKDDR
ncbi:hypothetical protein ACFL2Q_16205 [Thermodesulfobacteriota bacterium]